MKKLLSILFILIPVLFWSQHKHEIIDKDITQENIESIFQDLNISDTVIFSKCRFKSISLENKSIKNLKFVLCEGLYVKIINSEIEEIIFKNNNFSNIDFIKTVSSKIEIKNLNDVFPEDDLQTNILIDSSKFDYVSFNSGYWPELQDLIKEYNIQIFDSKFQSINVYSTIGNFELNDSEIKSSINIANSQFGSLLLFGNSFKQEPFLRYKKLSDPINLNINQCKVEYDFILRGSKFGLRTNSDTLPDYIISDSDFNKFYWINDSLNSAHFISNRFQDITIENSLNIENYLGLHKNHFPEYSSNIDFEPLKNKVKYLYSSDGRFYDKLFGNTGDEEFSNKTNYKNYLSTLNRFNLIFKERGDLEGINQTYIEIKAAETNYYKYLHQTEGGLKNYLNYNLGRFLRFFCDYGTSPIKAVIISFYVILIFAGIYFFTYSDWDRINRQFFISKSNQLIQYFTSEQKLEDFYSENYKADMLSYESFKENLKTKKAEVPFFFMLLMKPLYGVSVIKHRFNAWMYRRIEILKGRWVDLTKGKKILVSISVALWSITYLFYLAIVRGLNSLVLSVNTFSTLGFGDIPVKGLGRYIAIIEGFIGWFLLSIFSVSLISQILQN